MLAACGISLPEKNTLIIDVLCRPDHVINLTNDTFLALSFW